MKSMDQQQTKFNHTQIIQRKQYGNLIVLNQKYVHISVGPQYPNLLMGLSILAFFQIGLMILIYFQIESQMHKNVGFALCLITPVLYIVTALRDPGTYKPELCHEVKPKYCHACQHFTATKIKHCHICNICVKGYDHHCPWISKCIGKNNFICFCAFMVSMTSLNAYMYYTFYVIWKMS